MNYTFDSKSEKILHVKDYQIKHFNENMEFFRLVHNHKISSQKQLNL